MYMNDVSTIIRDQSDRGLERKKETPEPQALLQNMLEFIQEWEKAKVDGKCILNER